jgi:ankyrin repeat protein
VKDLHQAAAGGNLDQLKQILQRDPASVNERDQYDRTPLHYAAIEGHIEIAEFLLSRQAEINAQDLWGKTPLFVGIVEEPLILDHAPIVQFLVGKGADVNLADAVGDTPLHMAATFGETESVEPLLRGGADVNAKNDAGDTPLHCATLYSSRDVAKLLLAQPGIETRSRNNQGLTPCDFAIQKGWIELAEMIWKSMSGRDSPTIRTE